MKMYKSSLNGITELLKANDEVSGYADQDLIALYGTPQSGKTIFADQEAFCIASQMKRDILAIDTEGGSERMYLAWHKRFEERFKYKPKFDILRVPPDIVTVLELFGRYIVIKPFPSGKLQTESYTTLKQYRESYPKIFRELVEDGQFYYKGDLNYIENQYLKKGNYGVLIFDSVTQTYQDLPAIEKVFPARAAAVSALMIRLQNVATRYNMIILGLHHESKQPGNDKAPAKMTGGKAISHNFKIVLRIRRCGYAKAKNIREFTLRRFENKAPDEKYSANLTNEGYIDLTPEELGNLTRGGSEEDTSDAKPQTS